MSLRACLGLLLIVGAGAVACGGKTDGDFDGGGGDGGGTDGGPGPSGPCPQAEPSYGAACSQANLECEYGGDPRTTCNRVWSCAGGSWAMAKTGDPTCPSTNSAACPSDASLASGACGDPGATCDYSTSGASRWCACTFMGGPVQIDGGNQYTWQCGFGTMSGCPALRPRLGSACAQPDLECDYSVCGIPMGLSVRCEGSTGTWVTGFGMVCAGAN